MDTNYDKGLTKPVINRQLTSLPKREDHCYIKTI